MRHVFQFLRKLPEALVLLFVFASGFVFVMRQVFDLSYFHSLLFAVPAGAAIVTLFVRILKQQSRRANTPQAIENHAEFGEVRLFAERWEAVVATAPFPKQVEVVGSSRTPAPKEAALFREIRKRYDELYATAVDALSNDLQMMRPPASREDLVLSSVWLDGTDEGFSFYFDIPARRKEAPDGFYADFEGFEVQEAGWVH